MSSDSCNQIIVIGNGFDKACGLPSSYGEYFNDRFQKYEVGGKILPSLQKAIEEEGIEISLVSGISYLLPSMMKKHLS